MKYLLLSIALLCLACSDNISSPEEYQEVEYIESTGMLGSYFIDGNGWLTAVPEPAEWALIFGGLALAFVWYRRK